MFCYSFFTPFDMEAHCHHDIEINLAMKKGAVYSVGDEMISLKNGECIIINASHPHKLSIPNPQGGVYGIEIDREMIGSHPALQKEFSYYVFNSSQLIRCVLIDIVNKFCADYNDSCLPLCVSYLLQQIDFTSPLPFLIKEYIHEHYRDLSSVQDLSEHFYMSSVHLQRIFKERTGESIWNYVNQTKMTNAAYLLRTTNLPIEEIVSMTGFHSRQALYALFRKKLQLSPQSYRKKYKDYVLPKK